MNSAFDVEVPITNDVVEPEQLCHPVCADFVDGTGIEIDEFQANGLE